MTDDIYITVSLKVDEDQPIAEACPAKSGVARARVVPLAAKQGYAKYSNHYGT